MPKQAARQGWQWRALTDLARMESGHTPSRRHPEYWGGDVPWIGIRDAKRFHGAQVTVTEESTNQFGLANSSARLLPAGTVCLSRTASVGYVTIMSRPMATSQDFVNWVCGNELDPHFLSFLFLAQGTEFFKFSSGAVHQTIYFPEAKAFHVCIPSLGQQQQIAMQADKLKQAAADLETIYARKLVAIDELKQSILQKAFAGELTATEAVAA
jgi:type I restriction enzyme S subunit